MIGMIRDGYQFVRTNKPATIWKEFNRRDGHPFLQFVKYGICGVLAVAVNIVTFWALGNSIFPSFEVVQGMKIPRDTMITNYIWAQILAFIAANFAAYLTNLAWVFTGGRHHRVLEFLMFTAVSSIGFIVGLLLSLWKLKHDADSSTWFATGILIITSMIVNFICRKFIIFKG